MAKGVAGSSPAEDQKPVRTSLSITPEKTKKLKYIALMESSNITQLVNDSLQHTIDQYEKKNGAIPVK